MKSVFSPLRTFSPVFLCALVLSLLPMNSEYLSGASSSSQQQPSPPPLTIEKIKDNIYIARGGSGANCYFLTGKKSNIMFDAKMTSESCQQMLTEFKKISALPISLVILTHSDGDHVNGLIDLPTGIKIIGHKNTAEEMLSAAEQAPEIKNCLPSETYQDSKTISFEGTKIELKHYGPAHTSGDTVIYFPKSKVAIAGDLVFIGRDPLIHRHKNGSYQGLIKTLESMLAYKPQIEIFLSGHANPSTRKDVEDLLTGIKEKEAKIKELINQGKSLEEIKAFFRPEASPAQAGRSRWPSLVEIIYLELNEKK
jgi:glyoxylase-like metal-dependent hydrolase (beta-lactamase superfamily II)